ncbi:hypothetical protein [Lacticaseibacillus paracasei]|uniref:hypothetical protein n=1 Tax=Lacticaseibacillus paracasei TaxID=1597 RepID=UPI0034E5F7D5
MLKVVKRPKEYIAIKVPEDCEDVGKIVIEEAEKAGIRLDITTYYAVGRRWAIEVGVKNDETQTVKRGSIIVCKISQDSSKYPEAVDVMGQEEFDKKFKLVDEPIENINTPIHIDTHPILDQLKDIKAGMSTKIKGVTLSDDLKFSKSFTAELDKALNDYHQKQGQSSQRTSTPHIRIEFDDINDVPHVWIDGKRLGDEYPLKRINLEWNTNDAYIEPKHFLIDYFDMTKEAGAVAEQYGHQTQQRGVGQSNGVVRRSSTPRLDED